MKYSTYLRRNLTIGDFRKYPMQSYKPSEKGMENCLKKIINILKMKNKKSVVFLWDSKNKKEFNRCGWFGFTIIGKLLINSKSYLVEFYWRDNYQHTTSYLKINGIKVIELTKEYIHWDAGCSTVDNYLNIFDEIDNILK